MSDYGYWGGAGSGGSADVPPPDTLNIRDVYGTDAAAINEAIDHSASTGQPIRLSGGEFVCTSAIIFKDGMTLYCDPDSKVTCAYEHYGSSIQVGFIRQPDPVTAIKVNVYDLIVDTAINPETGDYYQGGVFGLKLKDSYIRRPHIEHYSRGQGWIVQLYDSLIDRPTGKSMNPEGVFGDGFFRASGGSNSRVINGDGYCRDDLWQLVTGANAMATDADKPFTNFYFINCTGESSTGRAVIIYIDEPSEDGAIVNCGALQMDVRGGIWVKSITDLEYSIVHGSRDGTTATIAGPLTRRGFRVLRDGKALSFFNSGDATWDREVTPTYAGSLGYNLANIRANATDSSFDRPDGGVWAFEVGDYITPYLFDQDNPLPNHDAIFRVTAVAGSKVYVTPAPIEHTETRTMLLQNYRTLKFPDTGPAGNVPANLKVTRVNPAVFRNITVEGNFDASHTIFPEGVWAQGLIENLRIDVRMKVGAGRRPLFLRGNVTNWNINLDILDAEHIGTFISNVGPGKLTGSMGGAPAADTIRFGPTSYGDADDGYRVYHESKDVIIAPDRITDVGDGYYAVRVVHGKGVSIRDVTIKERNAGLGRGVMFDPGSGGDVRNVDVSNLATTLLINKFNLLPTVPNLNPRGYGGLAVGGFIFRRKANNQDKNDINYAEDPEFLITQLEKDAQFLIDGQLLFTNDTGGTGGLKYQFLLAISEGSTGIGGAIIKWGDNASTVARLISGAGSQLGGTAGSTNQLNIRGLLKTGIQAVDLKVLWAQMTGSQPKTTMLEGSWLRLTRIS